MNRLVILGEGEEYLELNEGKEFSESAPYILDRIDS
jgi:hypothetical protein